MSDVDLKMMNLTLNEIKRYINECNNIITTQEKEIREFCDVLIKAKENDSQVFVGGAGRSGFVGKFFAMRLMHMGFKVYVFGESIVNLIRDDDVLIIISNTGKEESVPRIFTDSNKYDKVKLLSICGTRGCQLYKYSFKSILIEDFLIQHSSSEVKMLYELNFNEDDLTVFTKDRSM